MLTVDEREIERYEAVEDTGALQPSAPAIRRPTARHLPGNACLLSRRAARLGRRVTPRRRGGVRQRRRVREDPDRTRIGSPTATSAGSDRRRRAETHRLEAVDDDRTSSRALRRRTDAADRQPQRRRRPNAVPLAAAQASDQPCLFLRTALVISCQVESIWLRFNVPLARQNRPFRRCFSPPRSISWLAPRNYC